MMKILPPRRLPNKPRLFPAVVLPAEAVPMKAEITLAASTGPPPSVRPRAEALLVPSSFCRMMEVSASAPHPGVGQLRGVPSITMIFISAELFSVGIHVLTRQARHVHAVRALDLSDQAMSRDVGGQNRQESGNSSSSVTHSLVLFDRDILNK